MTISTDNDQTFVELILELHPGADRQALEQQLRALSLDPLPMAVGLMVSGAVADLRALVPSLRGDESGDLPVAPALAKAIKAIRRVKPRGFHGGQ